MNDQNPRCRREQGAFRPLEQTLERNPVLATGFSSLPPRLRAPQVPILRPVKVRTRPLGGNFRFDRDPTGPAPKSRKTVEMPTFEDLFRRELPTYRDKRSKE